MRPVDEWTWADAPELRIVPQDLWESVQSRRRNRRSSLSGSTVVSKPKYLFSGLLVCAECGCRYTLQDSSRGGRYACSGWVNRGPAVCTNTKKVKRGRLETVLLDALFNELFTPEAIVYLTHQVDAAIASATEPPVNRRTRLEKDLAQAKAELENVLTALRQGLVTPATRGLLDTCEGRVAECEAVLRAVPSSPPPVVSLSTVITRYLSDLQATLSTDVEAARALLAKLLGSVILRRDGSRLLAESTVNVEGLLLEETQSGDSIGAGRGI